MIHRQLDIILNKAGKGSGNNFISCVFWCKNSFIFVVARLRELENQLVKLEASNPSVPPALKFKVRCFGILYYAVKMLPMAVCNALQDCFI